MKLKRKLAIVLFICFLSSLIAACTSVAFAYFTKKQTYEGQFSGEVQLLFDRLDDTGIAAYQTALRGEGDNTTTVDKNADWGSKAYPYVISDVRHLYNLSELQKLGYFENRFLNKDPTTEEYIPNADGTYTMPHFLVCTPKYTPAFIDGENFRSIYVIGTKQFPFIGSVKGVKNTATPVTDDEHGKTYDTSVIHNVTVSCDSNNIDAGLFGVIGYLGDPSTATDGAFVGQVSTVSNLVLSDVKIEVKEKPLEDFILEKFLKHAFSFKDVPEADKEKVPHENHHIGILAGHATYANIEFISVYYSSDDVVAINVADATEVNGAKPNYLSATGILGFIDNLNPKVDVDADGNQSITAGSGDSLGNLSYSPVGGGGAGSGEKAGYVLAVDMYKQFCYTGTANNTTLDNDGTILIKDAVDKDGNALCVQGTQTLFGETYPSGDYYFYDGVFTFALSDDSDKPDVHDVIEPTWGVTTEAKTNNVNNTAVTDVDGTPVKNTENKQLYYEAAHQFSIGENSDSAWRTNTTKGNKAVVAFVKNIENQAALQTAITAGKQIYIGYEVTANNTTNVNLMSLYEDFSTSYAINANDNYTTKSLNKPFVTDTDTINGIQETLAYAKENPDPSLDGILPTDKDGKVNDDIITNISDYSLINLGTAEDLTTIKREYPITATVSNGSYTFKSSVSGCYLALLAVDGAFTGYRYSIFTGTKKASYWGGSTYWVQTASVTFNDDKTAYIRYDYSSSDGSESAYRYVYFNADKFKGTTNETATGTRLKFYSVEGTSNLDFGRITFDPKSGTTGHNFSAGEYVLKAGLDANAKTTYEVLSLENLLDEEGQPWNNGLGEGLTQADLNNKFKMNNGITFGAKLNLDIFGGISVGTSGFVTAPVGTQGIQANIPKGCIAFRMNKADTDNIIRVIVSVAVSEYYPGEKNGNDELLYELGDYTRYFNLWKMEEAGESWAQVFQVDSYLERFEIPRSHPYEPGKLPSESEYINVSYNGTDNYRCYLNGDRVLIAYEFKVDSTDAGTGMGIYCLGMSGINSGGNAVEDVPMEIVYFSASGVASSGRDGANGSQLGTIDFVYDFGGKVVTVTEETNTTGDTEDYNNYYPSYCLLYFDITQPASDSTETNPTFIPVNNEVVKIRRYVVAADEANPPKSDAEHNTTKSLSTLFYEFTTKQINEQNEEVVVDSDLVKIAQYAILADNVYPMPTPETQPTS